MVTPLYPNPEEHPLYGTVPYNEIERDAAGNIIRKFQEYHTGIDPLDDITISVPSKKRFMEWWRKHTEIFPIRNNQGAVDVGRMIRMVKVIANSSDLNCVTEVSAFDVVNASLAVCSSQEQVFPFRLNHVNNFTFELPNLRSYQNCPKTCQVGQFGSLRYPMKYLDTLVGGPIAALSMSVFTDMPFQNLATSLIGKTQSLTIHAPWIESLEGLNVEVGQLNLYVPRQKSFKGIHKMIHGIERLTIGVDQTFDGGVLSFAMMDAGIQIMPDVSSNPPVAFTEAMQIINENRKAGLNTHDIQELLIDSGYGKYAKP